MGGFALGGRFTTLEGILTNILEQVESNPFLGTTSIAGDSTTPEAKAKLEEFTEKACFLRNSLQSFPQIWNLTLLIYLRIISEKDLSLFLQVREMIKGKTEFTFIMDDPTGNSYLQVRLSLVHHFNITLQRCCLISRP